jgi:hypothetical protein
VILLVNQVMFQSWTNWNNNAGGITRFNFLLLPLLYFVFFFLSFFELINLLIQLFIFTLLSLVSFNISFFIDCMVVNNNNIVVSLYPRVEKRECKNKWLNAFSINNIILSTMFLLGRIYFTSSIISIAPLILLLYLVLFNSLFLYLGRRHVKEYRQ